MERVKTQLTLMLKTVLIVQQQQQKQQHQKEVMEIEVHVQDVEVVEIVHVVLMGLHQKKLEKIALQLLLHQQRPPLPINKRTMHIKIITHITVCRYSPVSLLDELEQISLDYGPESGTEVPWRSDKQSKRKKKLEGPLGVDPNAEVEGTKILLVDTSW